MPQEPLQSGSLAVAVPDSGAPQAAELHPRPGDALLVVDVQHDFLPGGALAVGGGDRVVGALNAYLDAFAARGLPVFATRCWHPPAHCSFREQGGPWPAHCIAGSAGAAFPGALHLPPGAVVVSKGTEAGRDAYSGFQGTDLNRRLKAASVRRLFVGGLATDYCVLETVCDAQALGYAVVALVDAMAAVGLRPDDEARALARMQAAGARLATRAEVL